MRRFKLINARGEEFDLMDKTAFFHRPSGLGLVWGIETIQARYDWIKVGTELELQQIRGDMVFLNYTRYAAFVKFCAYSPLTLAYSPEGTWYYRVCELAEILKDEFSEQTHRLTCPVVFSCLTVWYDNVTVHGTQGSSGGEGVKIYAYSYPYMYSEVTFRSIRVVNTGVMDSPCKLHIFGPVLNPSWALYYQGAEASRGKVLASIPQENKLVIDSSPGSLEIAEYSLNNKAVQNLYPRSDFSTARFVYLPPGESIISFTHEGTGDIIAWAEVRLLAATV